MNKSMTKIIVIIVLATLAILSCVAITIMCSVPKTTYLNERNEIVLKAVIGKPITISADSIKICDTPTLSGNLYRTNGLSVGDYHSGYFKNKITGERYYLFISGKSPKKCFEYNGMTYVVDDWSNGAVN